MLEEALPSIWALVHGWLTPTVLFVLLNLVIGTIAVTSKVIHRDADGAGDPRKLFRSPSLVLDRLRSFNLHSYRSGNIPLESAARSEPLETLHVSPDPAVAAESEAVEAIHAPEADPAGEEHHEFSRSQSDSRPTGGEVPVKLAAKMKKSASDKSMFAHFEVEEAEVVPLPATVRARTARREAAAAEEDDEGREVDARADDFINRFRQQLQLQRLDSIMRYKELLNRGAGNQT
ncbi:pathogen-associated molecular patterns-induced protein A70 [Elaeis guineensis]|uniref:Pathogen-associated molecular patterns-induced protein A70 n=1 Tax=Elaeis guineensis var. tenera TaxID=51953 RepID=A0A6I9RFK7_ELAGV|nr:pathogen-associated molecular patterns-induced protein A70 [Elaeis guineensis]